MRGHDRIFHRAGLQENFGKSGFAILTEKDDRATGFAKIGIDEERVETLLGQRDSVVRTAKCFPFAGHGAGKKEGAGVLVEPMQGERGPQRSEGFGHDTGSLLVDDKHAGAGGKTQPGDRRDDVHIGELLDLVDGFDAGIEKENADGEGNADGKSAKEALEPFLGRAGADGRSADGFFVNANR